MSKPRIETGSNDRLVASLNAPWIIPGALLAALAIAIAAAVSSLGHTTPPPDPRPAILALSLRAVEAEQRLLWQGLTTTAFRSGPARLETRGLETPGSDSEGVLRATVDGALSIYVQSGTGQAARLRPAEAGTGSRTPATSTDELAGASLDGVRPSGGYVDVDGRIAFALIHEFAPAASGPAEPSATTRLVGLFWLDRALAGAGHAAGITIDRALGGSTGLLPLLSADGRIVATLGDPGTLPVPLADRLPVRPVETALGLSFLVMLGVAIAGMRQRRRTASIVQDIEANAFDRAMRDPLTGLHNRAGFTNHLDQAIVRCQDGDVFGVIYIDLDRFKEVNDSYGHETGDRLLVAVTGRLRALCGAAASIARLGGDEFAAIVQGRDADEIVALGRQLTVELSQPFMLGTIEAVIGASVGIAVAPADGADSLELIRRADISMYRSKTSGRGQAHRFDSSMEDEVRRKKYLEGELRHAIERDELDVHYQPYFAADGETLVGVEALMRWQHRDEGAISPGVFIPLAEQTGLIIEISDWAMRKAIGDLRNWPGLSLAINVSPVQFRRKDLVASIAGLAAGAGIEPRRIEIEITEGVLVEDADQAIGVIAAFHEKGFKISLDDFGTGYASLSYLRRFKFDKLKVDQFFVRGLSAGSGGAAIVHSVVALGRSLGLAVQAEGIESLEHHIFLRASGCHFLQGFYFARPMNKDKMDAFFAARSGSALRFQQRA